MKLFTIWVGALLLTSQPAFSGNIDVNWHEPENYKDVRGADESDKRYQKRVFKQFEKFFQREAKRLPHDVMLKLKVTNINLAGEVQYSFDMGREIRMVSSLHWPKVEFEYLLAKGDRIVNKGQVSLKDIVFMDRAAPLGRDFLMYEKRLLSEWFRKDVEVMLANWHKQQHAVM